MTSKQRERMERLMVSYGAGIEQTHVVEGPGELPPGWVVVTIHLEKSGTVVQMGIHPDGWGCMYGWGQDLRSS